MRETIAFLEELRRNNCKEWMDAHRARYKELRSRFEGFVADLIEGCASFDPSVGGLTPKDCTYRMNRDIRFSPDKSPYKTHFSAFIAPRGKKSGLAGYYFHVEPVGEGTLIGYSCLAAGQVCIPPEVLRSIREEIVDHGDAMLRAIARARGFALDEENKLRRVPTGFAGGTPYDELLKLKDHCLMRRIATEELFEPDLLERTVERFRTTHPYIEQLNRAIRYAYEEMR